MLVRLAPADAASATRYRSGMVSDANDDGGPLSYDIIYDEADITTTNTTTDQQEAGEQQEEDEEDGVAADRVLGVPASPCVWCAARLNLARCSFRRGRHSEVRGSRRRRRKRRSILILTHEICREAWVVSGLPSLVVSLFSCCVFVVPGFSGFLWLAPLFAYPVAVERVVMVPLSRRVRCASTLNLAHRPLTTGQGEAGVKSVTGGTGFVGHFAVLLGVVRSVVLSGQPTCNLQAQPYLYPEYALFRTNRCLQVVGACTLVLAVARLAMAEKERPREERAKLRNHCLTALRMRGGSHLAQHHVGLARKDARWVLGYDTHVRLGYTLYQNSVTSLAKSGFPPLVS